MCKNVVIFKIDNVIKPKNLTDVFSIAKLYYNSYDKINLKFILSIRNT